MRLVLVALLCGAATGFAAGEISLEDLPNDAARPRAQVPYAVEIPALAARIDDPVWEKAEVLSDFTWSLERVPPSIPVFPVEVRVLWCPEALYVRFVSDGANLKAPFTQRDEKHFLGDVVEVFLDPRGEGRRYFEFQVSPANQIFDQRLEIAGKPQVAPSLRLRQASAKDFRADLAWNAAGLETASRIHEVAGKTKWVVELKIPAAALAEKAFAPGTLRANFLRYRPVPVPPGGDTAMLNWATVLHGCPHLSPWAMGYLELMPPAVEITSLTAPTPGGIFVFPRAPQKVEAALRNNTPEVRPLRWRLQILDHHGEVRHQADGTVDLPAGGETPIPLAFDATAWRLGPYEGKLDFFSDAAPAPPVITRGFRLGIVSDTVLEKARPGEFIYGLDPANNWFDSILTPTAFAWFRLMGVDIVRNLHNLKGPRELPDDIGEALEKLAAENVRSSIMVDPPKDREPAQRQTALERKTAFLEEISRRYAGKGPGKIHYFELGNEPDLPGFYPGPIPEYILSYEAMYDAIKRGARKAGLSDEDTVVMSGGLSFAGETGTRRATEFLRLVNGKKMDAVAYHGHGPGIEAERTAYEMVHGVAAKFGKADRPFVQTESGFAGIDAAGLREQARTVVEKMVYAQSQGLTTFMFFRLYMYGNDASYTLAENYVEPRPSILSYRNLVERLRRLRFRCALDFAGESGAGGVNAFLFEEPSPGGRKTLVAFCEKPLRHELRLRLGSEGENIASATMFDLYGNAAPVDVSSGIASFVVGVDPVFLIWESSGSPEIMPPLLAIQAAEPLLAGADNPVTITVHNPGGQPLSAQLLFEPRTRLTAKAEPPQKEVTLPAGAPVPVATTIRLARSEQPLALPVWWKVFLDVDHTKLTSEQLANFPETLAGTAGQFVWAAGNRLDFVPLAGGPIAKRPAIAYALLDSPRAVELSCGASGDWWMAWYLNGEKVLDTLEKGNEQHGPISSHPFTLSLRPGRNVLAVVVRSGLYGWNVRYGGPKELQLARTTDDDPDRLMVSFKSGDRVLAQAVTPLQLQGPIPLLGNVSVDRPESWMALEPLAVLGEDAIRNPWMKEPDSRRWYKGAKDLSGLVWLRDDGKDLHLFVVATDDRFVGKKEGDSLRVRIAGEDGQLLLEVTGGLVEGTPVFAGFPENLPFQVSRRDADTLYHLAFPKSLVGQKPFLLDLTIQDNDDGYLKQSLAMNRRLIAY